MDAVSVLNGINALVKTESSTSKLLEGNPSQKHPVGCIRGAPKCGIECGSGGLQ